MKCSECKHFTKISNTDDPNLGICTMINKYFEVFLDKECAFTSESLTCKDCYYFKSAACLIAKANDKPCLMYESKERANIVEILYKWKINGFDIREEIIDILHEVEDMPMPIPEPKEEIREINKEDFDFL